MSSLSCHVLDTTHGQPAPQVPVSLLEFGTLTTIATAVTDTDGRARFDCELAIDQTYTLRFATQAYCQQRFGTVFFPLIEVHFQIADQRHYHVPVLLSAYSYSTYRGS
ncbi:hydroxyisourate hydrolase [Vibrio sinaloensis]|uniref:hydroxyisourate hydrolase n=1 Tax=Photobacterium sp. (strain ATCC 43367) TaxID=379097 RepID=UPI00206D5436|nr:hydroxyisourate hydrolase [Vibrio sinaloensis]UPQ89346.1 hydroxyisourate hydrolase [Vibrio sinaloensis]